MASRPSSGPKRKRPAFSPPRPHGSSKSKDPVSGSKRGALQQDSNLILDSEPDYVLAEVTRNQDAENDEPSIPLPLIHTLLCYHFNDKDKTRITSGAKQLIGKYVDIFVREAIARSALEKKEMSTECGTAEFAAGADDGWLEVEDLEKMAPQLVLDF